MRGHFRHGLVKYIVKAGELGGFGKDGLGRCDQRKRLRDMYRREMCGGAKLFQDFWCDLLVGDEMGSTMNDTVANGCGRSVNVHADGFGDNVESMTLRFVDTFALDERFASGGTYVERTVVVANAIGTAGEQRFLIRFAVVI